MAARRPEARPLAPLLVGLVLAGALLPVAAGSPASAAEGASAYIVGFRALPDERETYQGEPVVTVDERLGFLVVETDEPQRFREDARQDDRVRYLEEDRRDVELAYTPNDPRYPDQYGPQITDAPSAWDTTRGSQAIVFGVLDTGIATDHEDVVADRVTGYDYVNDDGTVEDDAACGYHGTHVTGIASATIDNGAGIAGLSQHAVTMQKIFAESGGSCASGTISDVARALEDLADQGAHISSNSWTTDSPSTTLNEAIDYAHRKGTIHVAAAGNGGPCTDCVDYPWKDRPSKVAIASCTDEDDAFCSFSNQGQEIDVAAPGSQVLSLDGASTDAYVHKSGTSMSTPHVSGAVSLYLDEHGKSSFATVEDAVVSTADDVGLSEVRQGGGRLDAGELVAGVDNQPPTADFTYGCSFLDCSFDASASSDTDGELTSYDWTFGDGTTGGGEIATHTYDAGGTYTVNLTVTDDDGATDSRERSITVQAPQTLHVHRIDLRSEAPHVEATTWIHDEAEDPVDGAAVDLEICNAVGLCERSTELTDGEGAATRTWRWGVGGPYSACVLDVMHGSLDYDPADDHAADGNCGSELLFPTGAAR